LILGQKSTTARDMVGARSIQLKPGLLYQQSQSKATTLVPSFKTVRNPSMQLKKTASENKLPTLGPSNHRKQAIFAKPGMLLPKMKTTLSKSSLKDPTLSRINSSPQFQFLNQAPYFRPKTSSFGYKNEFIKKDPTKKAPWTSEEVNSITGIKVRFS
jgi:hypothetical protein